MSYPTYGNLTKVVDNIIDAERTQTVTTMNEELLQLLEYLQFYIIIKKKKYDFLC